MTELWFAPECQEYYCWSCGQLRLSLRKFTGCGNCGSSLVIFGEPGSLNRVILEKQRAERINPTN